MTIIGLIASTIGTFVGGGVVFKVVLDRFSMTKNEQYQALIMLIEQLQKNVNENNDEITQLKRDANEWRAKYYNELEEKNKLSLEVAKLTAQVQIFNSQHTS
jgi:site-specific DNA-adenine methylase